MRKLSIITAFLFALLLLGGCEIEPNLRLRQVASTKVVMSSSISVDMLWQVNWETKWDFTWNPAAYGTLGYTLPKGIRMHIYTLDDQGKPKSHNVYNFNGMQGEADVFVGTHDLIFHNNDSEVLLFRSDESTFDLSAYTRIISSGLKTSSVIQTIAQKEAASKADIGGEDDEINEQVALMPDELYVLYDPAHHITDNLEDYDFVDGKYVLHINGELLPHSFIWLVQVRLVNNLGRVASALGGAALTGMAESVDMRTGITSSTAVSVPTLDVYLNSAADPDLFGTRMMGFGIPGCNPYDPASVAAAPERKHWFVLNIHFNTGKYKNIRMDVTDQIRALPTGGVIQLELDVNDFPPEDTDPPIGDETGGFKPFVQDWDEESGHTTIIN